MYIYITYSNTYTDTYIDRIDNISKDKSLLTLIP